MANAADRTVEHLGLSNHGGEGMSTTPLDPDKEGDDEDVRQSANISVAISNYVATAALGVLAGSVVLFTYVSGAFALEAGFYWLIGAGVVSLVASIFVGGRGSAAVAKAVGRAEYHPNEKSESYNWQAILTLLGLVLVLISAVARVTVARLHSDADRRLGALEKKWRSFVRRADTIRSMIGCSTGATYTVSEGMLIHGAPPAVAATVRARSSPARDRGRVARLASCRPADPCRTHPLGLTGELEWGSSRLDATARAIV
jgi:hypothetical protein